MARPRKGVTFWDRVYDNTERRGGCLLFTGHKDECGYGRINRDGKLVRVHRAVWERDNGPIPEWHVVMHSCDKPACIEPAHLSLGTQEENIRDMDRKGRRISLVGQEHGNSKLTDTDIPSIRARLSDGQTCAAIARDYQVSEGLIRHIKKGRAWRHVELAA